MDAESLRGNVNRFTLPAPAPIAETYFEKNRLIEDMFCHEQLEVYQKSVEFLKEVISVIRLLQNGNSDIVNQLRCAATSIWQPYSQSWFLRVNRYRSGSR